MLIPAFFYDTNILQIRICGVCKIEFNLPNLNFLINFNMYVTRKKSCRISPAAFPFILPEYYLRAGLTVDPLPGVALVLLRTACLTSSFTTCFASVLTGVARSVGVEI